MVLWSVPMTLKTSRRLFNLVEIIAAWSALDVFLVSIMAAVLEIGALSQEVISSAFGSIESAVCDVLGDLPPSVLNALLHAIGLPGLDLSRGCTLFRVDAVLSDGCWLLLAAVLACEICSHIIVEFADAAIAERMAMLSAYHHVRGRNPSRVTARQSSDGALERQESADRRVMLLFTPESDGTTRPPMPPASRQLRRLLSAQELGSTNFVGAWSDAFYGPFPRNVWSYFVKGGCMRRVEWEEIGYDLREDLVVQEPLLSENSDSVALLGGVPYALSQPVPLPGLARHGLIHGRSREDEVRERLLSSSPAWTPDSPAV